MKNPKPVPPPDLLSKHLNQKFWGSKYPFLVFSCLSSLVSDFYSFQVLGIKASHLKSVYGSLCGPPVLGCQLLVSNLFGYR